MKNTFAPDHFVFEELEKRILFSADIAVLAPELPGKEIVVQDLPQYQSPVVPAQTLNTATGDQQAQTRHEVVFIDGAVDNAQQLADELLARQDTSRTLDVVMLAQGKDGVAQISDYLATQHDLNGIHIISHGADGELQLGSTRLNSDNLLSNALAVSGWGAALAPGGDILLYGCDVALTSSGQQFVDSIGKLTGADIAASNDLTGSAAKQGDWNLEYSDGKIETQVAPDAAIQLSYSGILSIFTVSNNADSGAGSLRQAITDANASGGADTINFSIGNNTITLTTFLPTISDTVTIDGRTAAGYGGSPVVEINGNGLTGDGLSFAAGAANSAVYGLSVTNFNGVGISVTSAADGVTIQGNYLGLRTDGQTVLGNQNGVQIASSNNVVGGSDASTRNVISGNTNDGVRITLGDNTVVQGNYVGTDATGSAAAGNGYSGISVIGGTNAVIGGTTSGTGNLVSANQYAGIYVSGGPTGILIAGNWVGLDISGNNALGNSGHGISLDGASGVTIGGTTAAARNVSAGNAGDGINITGSNNTVLGNYSGTNADGSAVIANTKSGVAIDGSGSNNVVGGTSAGSGNVLSGNVDAGVWVGGTTTGTVIQGNYLGLNAAGTGALGNKRGVSLNGTTDVVVGGGTAGARNIISGNKQDGIWSTGSNSLITGNYIGLNAAGNAVVSNLYSGLALHGSNDIIGDTGPNGRNIISGSGRDGIYVDSPNGEIIQNNRIGLDAFGYSAANNWAGINVHSGTGTQIGGTASGAGNEIVDNTRQGIRIEDAATGVSILRNGISDNGGLGIDLGTTLGVTPNDSGDGDTGANNLQNFPVITAVQTSKTHSAVQGTFNSNANRTYILEFYASFSPDASGYGQGATYVGTVNVTTDASGNATYATALAGLLTDGTWISATATDTTTNETSEFGLAVQATTLNNAPVGSSNTVTGMEDTPYTFAAADFGFGDPDSNTPNAFLSVFITTLPATGSLTSNGVAITAGSEVTVADINAGKLIYTPLANANGGAVASYSFKVRDDGGTANGGNDTDATDRSMNIGLTPVNDAPAGADHTASISQTSRITFAAADFGFTDPSDTPANNFLAVRIGSLPANGTLTDNGTTIAAGMSVSKADIDAGLLLYTPATGAAGLGSNVGSFTFRVQDDGGTQNGGQDTDQSARTMDISVTAAAVPVLGVSAGSINYSSAGAPVAVDGGLSVTDADSTTLASGSVRISSNFNAAQDMLAFTANSATMGNISGSYNAATGVLSLNSTGATATTAQWQAALRAVTYQNTALTPSTAIRTVSISVDDGTAGSTSATRALHTNTLSAGDIAVLGFDSVGRNDIDGDGLVDGRWAIVALTDLKAGSVINITDAGIDQSGNFINAGNKDGHLTWTLTSDIAAGTILSMDTSTGVNFNDLNGAATGKGGLSDYGTVSGSLGGTSATGSAFNGQGDQIIIYQGNAGQVAGSTFLYAFTQTRNNGGSATGTWQSSGTASGSSQSYLPPGLVNGVTAVALTSDTGASIGTGSANTGSANYAFASMMYQGTLRAGTKAAILAALADPASWYGDNSASLDFDVGAGHEYSSNFTVVKPALVAGDIAVLGFDSLNYGDINGDGAGDGHWAIVALTTLKAGTVIHFTDAGINATQDGFISNPSVDSHLTWTLTQDVAAGTILTMDTSNGDNFADLNGAAAGKGGLTDYGTVSGRLGGTGATNSPIAPNGDQLIIYQGDLGVVTGSTFIYAFNDSRDSANAGTGGWQTSGAATGESQSYIPPGLVDGYTAVALTTNTNNSIGTGTPNAGSANYGFNKMRYAGTLSGTREQLLTALADPTHWQGGSGAGYSYTVGPGNTYASNFTVRTVALATSPGTHDYTEGDIWSDIDAGLTLGSDNNDQITAATVSIGSGFSSAQDFLINVTDAATMGNITTSYDPASGVMTLTSAGNTATLAQWQSALQSIGYGNSSDNPDTSSRVVTYTVHSLAGDTISATRTITVTAVNDAPVVSTSPAATPFLENGAAVAVDPGVTLNDVDNPTLASARVEIVGNMTLGDYLTFTNDGSSMGNIVQVYDIGPGVAHLVSSGATATLAQWQAALRAVKYVSLSDNPGSNDRTVSFIVNDGSLDSVAATKLVSVTAVNDAPAGADHTANVIETVPYTFSVSDFGFTDPRDGGSNNFVSVAITTLPSIGVLTYNGTVLAAGDSVLSIDIAAGKLVYSYTGTAAQAGSLPSLRQKLPSFAGDTSFTFQVRDDGGTANGGIDTDATARKMTLAVTPVNRAPAGADNTVTTLENTPYTFSAGDFGFSDPDNTPANSLLQVVISSLPAGGTLSYYGATFTAGNYVHVSDLNAGALVYTPASNANGAAAASFTFRVQDSGGTAYGGIDTDPLARVMTIAVTSVNNAPAGTDHMVQLTDNKAYAFTAADFGYSDAADRPANNFVSVLISGLPTGGALTLNGGAVKSGSVILKSDIDAGRLVFTPVAYSTFRVIVDFTFRVQDDGGVANGGVDIDALNRTMTLDIASSLTANATNVVLPSGPAFTLPANDAQGNTSGDSTASRAAASAASSAAASAAAAGTAAGPAAPATRVDLPIAAGARALAIETDASVIRANIVRFLGDKAETVVTPVVRDLPAATAAPESGSVFKVDLVVQAPVERHNLLLAVQKTSSSDASVGKVAASPPTSGADNQREYSTLRATAHRIEGAIAVSALGTIWVMARKAAMVASLLSTVPAWMRLDPLPILGAEEEPEEEGEQGQTEEQAQADSVEHLFTVEGKAAEASQDSPAQ